LQTILTDKEIIDLQKLTRQVHISEELIVKVNQLVRSTRPDTTSSAYVKKWCGWGAGPRAGQALILCSKARAVLNQRFSVIPEDIQTLAYPVLRHRISLNFRAEAENITTDDVVAELLKG
jgi:MoxR-like ATPase